MRRRLALLVLAVSGALVPVLAPPVSAQPAPSSLTKTCGRGYVLAHLSWGDKCLRAGQFCKVGNREYIRWGFSCPPTGHLRRR